MAGYSFTNMRSNSAMSSGSSSNGTRYGLFFCSTSLSPRIQPSARRSLIQRSCSAMASVSISGPLSVKLAASQSRNGASSYSILRNFAAMSRAWARLDSLRDSSSSAHAGAWLPAAIWSARQRSCSARDGFERSAPDEIDRANALQRRENDDVCERAIGAPGVAHDPRHPIRARQRDDQADGRMQCVA